MDINDQESKNNNCERIKKGFIFAGHNLEPYTRKGIEQIHLNVCASLADSKPCRKKCSLTFGNNVRRWCKTCDNWRKKLLSFCSVPVTMSWKKMESWKWPYEHTTIARVYLPRSWDTKLVDFNDFSIACSLWRRCSIYNISPRVVKDSNKYMSLRGGQKVTNEEKQHVFYVLEELFYQSDVESSLELNPELYINELHKISSEQKDRTGENKYQYDMKRITYLHTGKQRLRLPDLFDNVKKYASIIFLVLLFSTIYITWDVLQSSFLPVVQSYYKLETYWFDEEFRFSVVVTVVSLTTIIIATTYLSVRRYLDNTYDTGLVEKLLSDYECRGMYKPWKPHRQLTDMFDLTFQHSLQSTTKDILNSVCTIVSGANMKQSRLCIGDVLNIWGDIIRYKKEKRQYMVNLESTSAIAKFNLAFCIRVRKHEVIYDLNEFISKRISSYLKSLNVNRPVSALLNRECLVILDLNKGNIRSPHKLHQQIMGTYKVLLFVNDSQVITKRICGIDKVSCSGLLAQCGEVTTLTVTRRKGITRRSLPNEFYDYVMTNLSKEINTALFLKSFQCKRGTKLFDIIFQDIRSPNSLITTEIDLRNSKKQTKSGQIYVRNLELINCDSSILLLHSAEKVLFKKGYYLNELLISNCMLCFPSCVNLRTVVFSDIMIGREQINITLSEEKIRKFKLFTRIHDVVLEIFMPYFGNSINFNKEDFCIEDQRCNSIGKEIILNQICHQLVTSDPNNAEAYASKSKDDDVIIVVLTREMHMTCKSQQLFRNFPVEVRPYYPSSKSSLRAENSVESMDEMLKETFSKQLFALNETVSYHAGKLMEQHSNLEAIKVSIVHISEENIVEAGPCVVLYCRCKSFIPYGERSFPTYLKHPSEDIAFLTNVREGYFIPCTNGKVMSGFAKLWNKEMAMGCSIGPDNEPFSATCGPFVDVKETGETCFLTVRHLFQPLSKPDQQVIGTKLVQPADGDIIPSQASAIHNPVAAGVAGQQGNNTPERRCGEVIASALSETVDAVLVRIDDARVPRRGNYVNVTKDDLYFAGFSDQNFPTYDDGSTLDARPLTVHDQATDRVIKFGKETGLRKGTLHLSSVAVKEDMCTGSVQLNGRPFGHTLKNQLQIDSYASSTFFQAGDSGSAVFLVDKENKLHCIGLAIGVMSDLTTVVTPIQNILHGLGRQLGKTLEIKKFELEKMHES